MVQSSPKLWVQLLSDRYAMGVNTLLASAGPSVSFIWSSILHARDVLKDGFSWRAGSGNSSFWSCPWSSLGILGRIPPYIDIHDLQLTVKDVISSNNPHTNILYTQLPPFAADTINNIHFKFNASVEYTFIWHNNKNGTITPKSGYNWLLSRKELVIISNLPPSWSWIWKLHMPEKIKIFFWLACHNSVPTLSMRNHRNIAPSPICSRCGLHDETFLHCVRDCAHSKSIWHRIGFIHNDFFSTSVTHEWLKNNSVGHLSFTLATTIWWAWRNRNMMCLENKNWTLNYIFLTTFKVWLIL